MLLLKFSKQLSSVIVLFLAIIVVNFSMIPNAHSGIFSGEKKWFSHKLEDAGESMNVGVRKEFKKAMNQLFDAKIAPLLQDIDLVMKNKPEQVEQIGKSLFTELNQIARYLDGSAKQRLNQAGNISINLDQDIEKRLKQVDKIFKDVAKNVDQRTKDRLMQFNETVKSRLNQVNDIIKIVDDVVGNIDQIVESAIDRFEPATDKTIDGIREDVITHSVTILDNLRGKFRKNIDHFFNRTGYIINAMDCKVETQDEQLYVKKPTNKWIFWRDSPYCYKIMRIKQTPKSFEYATIYELKKCELLMSLGPETPIKRIQNVYLDLKTLAARMMCVQYHAGEHAKRHYTWDWLEFGGQYDFWEELCPSPCKIPTKIPEELLSN